MCRIPKTVNEQINNSLDKNHWLYFQSNIKLSKTFITFNTTSTLVDDIRKSKKQRNEQFPFITFNSRETKDTVTVTICRVKTNGNVSEGAKIEYSLSFCRCD